jgi:hypothetical protein
LFFHLLILIWVIWLLFWFRLAELVLNLEKDRKIFVVFAGWV